MMGNGGDNSSSAFRCLVRRKRVDAATQTLATHQLARKLSLFDLVAIGNSPFTLYWLTFYASCTQTFFIHPFFARALCMTVS